MDALETGVPGLDRVLGGGIPRGYTLLVGGVPAASKTVPTSQIGFHQARQGGRVLVLSVLAESATKLAVHLGRFSLFDPELIGETFQILDLQRLLTTEGLLILDSLRGLHTITSDGASVHRFVHGLGVSMFTAGCTTVLLDDRTTPGNEVSAELTLADAVISLEVSLRGRRELRRLRAVKVRGATPDGPAHIRDHRRRRARLPARRVDARRDAGAAHKRRPPGPGGARARRAHGRRYSGVQLDAADGHDGDRQDDDGPALRRSRHRGGAAVPVPDRPPVPGGSAAQGGALRDGPATGDRGGRSRSCASQRRSRMSTRC